MCKHKLDGRKPRADQIDSMRQWRDALEGDNRERAYELMNQVMDGKITFEAALALLKKKTE